MPTTDTFFNAAREELAGVLARSQSLTPVMQAVGAAMVACLQGGGKILACGNGGSACDALHLTEELTGRYRANRRALPAICLNADPAALTCIANDFGYEQVFARQVEALAVPGDLLVGFTTSGNSPNVLAAFAAARARGVRTVLVSGQQGGKARGQVDFELLVPSTNTARVQEVHTLLLHAWLEQVEQVWAAGEGGRAG